MPPLRRMCSRCFNPSVGILFVHTELRAPVRALWAGVSIPRSGFCLFIRVHLGDELDALDCFNPSVGILFVHTFAIRHNYGHDIKFQSLGRDSVCSYAIAGSTGPGGITSFNPSVGILFVHTKSNRGRKKKEDAFQSLGRDSVCSYISATADCMRAC